MGNSLEQYRTAIGFNNSGPKSKREQPDVFWVALTDLVKIILVLQILLAGLLVLQLHLYDQPWQFWTILTIETIGKTTPLIFAD